MVRVAISPDAAKPRSGIGSSIRGGTPPGSPGEPGWPGSPGKPGFPGSPGLPTAPSQATKATARAIVISAWPARRLRPAAGMPTIAIPCLFSRPGRGRDHAAGCAGCRWWYGLPPGTVRRCRPPGCSEPVAAGRSPAVGTPRARHGLKRTGAPRGKSWAVVCECRPEPVR